MEIIKVNSKEQIVNPKNTELVDKIKRSLEDVKHGRIKEWKG